MSSHSEDKPFSDSHLESPAYRKRLLRKLNTLIAVLEVACAKVRRSLKGPEPDVERLTRIHKNLKDTLGVCQRAKRALQRQERLPADLPPILGDMHIDTLGEGEPVGKKPKRENGATIELNSPEEQEKFEGLGPITREEIRNVDLDDLCGRLLFG